MINLTRGVPAVESYALDEFVAAFKTALAEDGPRAMSYVPSPGYPPLVEWIAAEENVSPDQVLIGNSSLEFLHFISMVETEPGDRVFLESPSYDRANLLLQRRGLETVGIPLETDGIDLNVLESEIKKGRPKLVYLIPDFQNPMGTTTSLEKRQAIAELARKHDFWILEDIPYRRLRYSGEDLPTIASLAPERVVKMGSYSKTLAPGLRLGFLIGDADFLKRVKVFAGNTYIGPVSPTQALAYQFLKLGFFEPNLKKIHALYGPRLRKTLEILAAELPGAVYPKPEGGFFVGVTLPEGNDMETLLPRAKEAGLNLTDGRGFYLNPEDGRRFLRIPFCGLSEADLEKAFEALLPLIVR